MLFAEGKQPNIRRKILQRFWTGAVGRVGCRRTQYTRKCQQPGDDSALQVSPLELLFQRGHKRLGRLADPDILVDLQINGRHHAVRDARLHVWNELLFGIPWRRNVSIETDVGPVALEDEIGVRLQSLVRSTGVDSGSIGGQAVPEFQEVVPLA